MIPLNVQQMLAQMQMQGGGNMDLQKIMQQARGAARLGGGAAAERHGGAESAARSSTAIQQRTRVVWRHAVDFAAAVRARA